MAKHAASATVSATKETIINSIRNATPKVTQPIIQLPNNTSLEILTILINAHLTCLKEQNPDYNAIANRGLRRAGLPEVTLKNDINSADILRVIAPEPREDIMGIATSQESILSHVKSPRQA